MLKIAWLQSLPLLLYNNLDRFFDSSDGDEAPRRTSALKHDKFYYQNTVAVLFTLENPIWLYEGLPGVLGKKAYFAMGRRKQS
jgi:hypothetical protein